MTLLPLIVGLVLFFAIHAFSMNRAGRARLVERLGLAAYRGVYGVLAAIGLVLIVYGYGHYRAAGMIPVWVPPPATRHITFLLVLLAFILLAASHAPTHIKRIEPHPMTAAVILWSLGHLLARGDLGSVLMFGAFLVWGVAARISMAHRVVFDPQGTSVAREPSWQADIIVVAVGVAFYALFLFWLHPLLIGIPLVTH